MKKQFYLTLLLALFSAATVWAQFAPEEGKMYALKETTSGLYLDIQTLGINEPNAGYTTNNISLNTNPCVIYFAKGTTDASKWTMKNVNGTYAMQASSRNCNATIGATAYEWTIAADPNNGIIYTIARADGCTIYGATNSGAPLYCDCNGNNGTPLKFKLMEYTHSYELGDIKSSADLMAATTATHIVIKNCATNNSYYLAGTSNKENWESAILVWEPVTNGTPGTYYLRTTDATNGYIQSAATGTNVSLGTKTGAQVFYTTEPTGSGSGPTLCNAIGDLSGADTDNLVRFVQNGSEVWLNCQTSDGNPKYTGTANSAYGVWTVHNVYAVNVTETLTEAEKYIVGSYTLKTVTGTFLSSTSVADDTEFSFQNNATEFIMEPADGNGYYIKLKDSDPAKYVSVSSNGWGATASTTPYAWLISAHDTDGYATISRAANSTLSLGHTDRTTSGTPIYSNAASASCNKWYFTGTYNVPTEATTANSKYRFTSGLIKYAGACNKLRFTLTESAGKYNGGTYNRFSLDYFELRDANGNKVELDATAFTGNNEKSYANMLDAVNDKYCCSETWNAATTSHDWFEFTLDKDVDLGGAFSFSFVTENTTMNAKAFRVDISYEKRETGYTLNIENAPAEIGRAHV